MGAEGDVSSLCVSQADDCRLLGQLPKVKCLRNGRREGKSCNPAQTHRFWEVGEGWSQGNLRGEVNKEVSGFWE